MKLKRKRIRELSKQPQGDGPVVRCNRCNRKHPRRAPCEVRTLK